MDYRGETFRNCRVDLDGNRFFECMFDRVAFHYNGGPITLEGCVFSGYTFVLGGDLGRGLEVMRLLAHQGGPKSVKALVDDISRLLRRNEPITTVTLG